MKISKAGSIAIHALALVAGQDKGKRISSTEIIKAFGISKNHLAKVMQDLVKAGILKSDRGPAGGFTLSKSPTEISLLDIYTVIEGDISLEQCLLEKKFCFGDKCVLGGLISRINNEIYDYLKNTTVKDIAIRSEKGDKTNEKKNNKNT